MTVVGGRRWRRRRRGWQVTALTTHSGPPGSPQCLGGDPHPGRGRHHGQSHAAVPHDVSEVEQLVVLRESDEVLKQE